MNLNNIYLNPLEVAVPYYSKNQFRNTTNSDKLIHDSSDSKSKSKSKSKTKTIRTAVIPSMTMNLRARRNWNKTKTKFKAMSVIRENINNAKTRSKSKSSKSKSKSNKSPKSERSTLLLLKVDEIVDGLSRSEREMATFNDILDLVKRDLRNISEKDEDLIEDHIYTKYNIENY